MAKKKEKDPAKEIPTEVTLKLHSKRTLMMTMAGAEAETEHGTLCIMSSLPAGYCVLYRHRYVSIDMQDFAQKAKEIIDAAVEEEGE